MGGWRAYEWYETKRAAETGAAFEAAQMLDQEGKGAEAESAYAKVVADGTASYRDLARVRQAAELAQRDSKLGIAAYEKVADDKSVDSAWRDLAAAHDYVPTTHAHVSPRGGRHLLFAYPADIRKVIYTTNAVESLNMSLRKVIKTRGSFPNAEAALKLLFLALEHIAKKWTMPVQNWKAALQRFAILLGDRVPQDALT